MPATGMEPREVLAAEKRSMGHGKVVLLRGYKTHISRPRIAITFIVYWHMSRPDTSYLQDRRLICLRYALAVDGRVTASGIMHQVWRKVKK